MTAARMPTQNILLVLVIYICVNCLVVQDRSNMGRQMKSRAEASMRRIVERVTTTKIIILFGMDVFQSKKGNINTTTSLHLMFR